MMIAWRPARQELPGKRFRDAARVTRPGLLIPA